MAERLKAAVSKTVVGATPPGVRIPPSPPLLRLPLFSHFDFENDLTERWRVSLPRASLNENNSHVTRPEAGDRENLILAISRRRLRARRGELRPPGEFTDKGYYTYFSLDPIFPDISRAPESGKGNTPALAFAEADLMQVQ